MKFSTIVIDSPWGYSNKKTGGGMQSGASQKYPTLSLDDILNFDISAIADKDSVIFSWVPSPLIEYGLKALISWGYHYKFGIYWVKKDLTNVGGSAALVGRVGMGYWMSGDVEICLVGTKGKVTPYRSQISNVIIEKPRGHSIKPDTFWTIVNRVKTNPAIELFARVERDGWECWGNEVNSTFDASVILKKD